MIFIYHSRNYVPCNKFIYMCKNRNDMGTISSSKKSLNLFHKLSLLFFFTIQRLNARNLIENNKYIKSHCKKYNDDIYAYIIGLIEGNGWIGISKKGKYLTYELGIELNIRDIQLL